MRQREQKANKVLVLWRWPCTLRTPLRISRPPGMFCRQGSVVPPHSWSGAQQSVVHWPAPLTLTFDMKTIAQQSCKFFKVKRTQLFSLFLHLLLGLFPSFILLLILKCPWLQGAVTSPSIAAGRPLSSTSLRGFVKSKPVVAKYPASLLLDITHWLRWHLSCTQF